MNNNMKREICKRAAAFIMGACILISRGLTVFASQTTQSISTAGNASISVTAMRESAYTVIVPAAIVLEKQADGKYEADYELKAYGDISDSSKLSMIPSDSFTLTGSENAAHTATATVTQTKKYAVNTVTDAGTQVTLGSNEANPSTISGRITCELNNADAYTGNFSLTISLEDV